MRPRGGELRTPAGQIGSGLSKKKVTVILRLRMVVDDEAACGHAHHTGEPAQWRICDGAQRSPFLDCILRPAPFQIRHPPISLELVRALLSTSRASAFICRRVVADTVWFAARPGTLLQRRQPRGFTAKITSTTLHVLNGNFRVIYVALHWLDGRAAERADHVWA
jgi:hypothetical protein